MADTHPWPPIDPGRNQVILIVGRKGSGKSVAARTLFRSWPGADRVVIDVTGDADPGADLHPVKLGNPVPSRLPAYDKDAGPQVYRWIADPHSATYRDDLDAALALGLWPSDRHVVMWVDEAGEVFKVNQVGPHGRTSLHQGRHHHLSLLLACPRAVGIDPLCLAQADRVLMYDVPNPKDRERLAEALGIPPKTLHQELNATRKPHTVDGRPRGGEHWYLMYVADEHQLYRCPPLPQK